MGFDDFVDVRGIHVAVPHSLGVDHDARPFLATLEAPGLIDPHLPGRGKAQLLDALFGMFLRFLGACIRAAHAIARIALVQAKEDVVFIICWYDSSPVKS